jgi:GNAT superfamily N-acetyltransferase
MTMQEHSLSDRELDRWVEMSKNPAGAGAKAFLADFERWQKDGFTHLTRHYYSEWDGFAERKAAMEAARVPILQQKRTFSWNEPKPPVDVPDRLSFRSMTDAGREGFLQAAALALSGTLDRVEQAELARLGDRDVRDFVCQEWEGITEHFDYEPVWWQLAYDGGGDLVGYTQPVTYPGADREGLKESSLYHIAVLPEHRGNGYINDILARSVATMQRVGVWLVFCDTDTENTPMIRAFQHAGFDEEGVMYRWRGDLSADGPRKGKLER